MGAPEGGFGCNGWSPAVRTLYHQTLEACTGSWPAGVARDYCTSSATECVEQKRACESTFELAMPNCGRLEVQSFETCFQTAIRITGVFWPEASGESPASPHAGVKPLAEAGSSGTVTIPRKSGSSKRWRQCRVETTSSLFGAAILSWNCHF